MAVELSQEIDIALIRIDGDTQPRAALNHETINDYAQNMNEGDIFPPVIVHYDGENYWLTDGFHRYHAAKLAGKDTVNADIRQGDRRQAKWESYAVNSKNGMRMTTADKQKIVTEILQDPEWSQYPNTVIARHCGVDEGTIRKYRIALTSEFPSYRHIGNEKEYGDNQSIPANNQNLDAQNCAELRRSQPLEIPLLPFQEAARQDLVQEYPKWEPPTQPIWARSTTQEEAKEQRDAHTMRVMGSSDSPEWYTPPEIVEKVLELMGTIELDPCSNSHDDPKVPAITRYTKDDDGLSHEWKGSTYLNPPYGTVIGTWTNKLIESYKSGDVTEAIALLPGRIDTNWFSPLYEYLICIIKGRVQFENSPYHAPFPCVLVYLGNRRDEFTKVFGSLGPIVERIA